LNTESIRRVREWSSMDLVKRNAVIVDLPEASINGIWRNERTNSNGYADFFHFLFCSSNFGAGSATLYYNNQFQFSTDSRKYPSTNGYFLKFFKQTSMLKLLNFFIDMFKTFLYFYLELLSFKNNSYLIHFMLKKSKIW